MSKGNYFQYSQDSPFHLSAGALVYSEQGKILTHVFGAEVKENPFDRDIYILIRETIERQESVEAAIHRGIREETGGEATIVNYLGAVTGKARRFLDNPEDVFEKTTLYFAMKSVRWQPGQRDGNDAEAASDLQWHEPKELIPIMKQQGEFTDSEDLDESVIVQRFLEMSEPGNIKAE